MRIRAASGSLETIPDQWHRECAMRSEMRDANQFVSSYGAYCDLAYFCEAMSQRSFVYKLLLSIVLDVKSKVVH
jgi:hypothetical protein